ncbi:DUF3021 domain-containing protein [Anaerococcus sp. AGMB00486]|uniref:DUF3021 domain-containing protein n=2 Tax=Anaerococcus TaxID=165779 RepID=A0ABX2NA80_9FIRM|nr:MULTISPECIES: DUF3021 domain-containing protein [Anaerococcus]MSS77747.1 DUF3021 domain-containing protein [Anaerococcus porci]NVF11602.1 DUF3021 domain-containing protein [Anaerococcus faecalis]
MKKFFKYIISFVIGVGIGNLIELFISMLLGKLMVGVPEFVNSQSSLLNAKIIETILYGGFGIVANFLGGKITYENLSKNTIIHFLGMVIYFSITGLYLKWFASISSLIIPLVSFTLIYALIWYIIYRTEKMEVQKINKKLNEINKE